MRLAGAFRMPVEDTLVLACVRTFSCVQLVGEGDIAGTQLLPWQQLHQGSVAALDICTETRQVICPVCPPQILARVRTPTQAVFCLSEQTPCERAALQHAILAITPSVAHSSPWQASCNLAACFLQAVTAGADGALRVVPLDDAAAPAQSIMEPRSSASYSAVRWSSPEAFVTAGTTGVAPLAITCPDCLPDR